MLGITACLVAQLMQQVTVRLQERAERRAELERPVANPRAARLRELEVDPPAWPSAWISAVSRSRALTPPLALTSSRRSLRYARSAARSGSAGACRRRRGRSADHGDRAEGRLRRVLARRRTLVIENLRADYGPTKGAGGTLPSFQLARSGCAPLRLPCSRSASGVAPGPCCLTRFFPLQSGWLQRRRGWI